METIARDREATRQTDSLSEISHVVVGLRYSRHASRAVCGGEWVQRLTSKRCAAAVTLFWRTVGDQKGTDFWITLQAEKRFGAEVSGFHPPD